MVQGLPKVQPKLYIAFHPQTLVQCLMITKAFTGLSQDSRPYYSETRQILLIL